MGLCKKVGEVSPMDDPNIVLKTLREQGFLAKEPGMVDPPEMGSASGTSGRHRNSDDAMAMSIDDNDNMDMGNSFPTGQRQNVNLTAKARREVCSYFVVYKMTLPYHCLQHSRRFVCLVFRWHIPRLVRQITLLQRYWPLRMELQDTPILLPLIGGV
jgi:hypothetical protein